MHASVGMPVLSPTSHHEHACKAGELPVAYRELQQACKALGLPAKRNAATLGAQLSLHITAYRKLQQQQACKERGLPAKCKAAHLRAQQSADVQCELIRHHELQCAGKAGGLSAYNEMRRDCKALGLPANRKARTLHAQLSAQGGLAAYRGWQPVGKRMVRQRNDNNRGFVTICLHTCSARHVA